MATLLTPPKKEEKAKGFLWWKKWELTFRTQILSDDHAKGVALGLFRALAQEREKRRRVESIFVTVIGSVESTFHAYESFRLEGESDTLTADWLVKEVEIFDLTFETSSGELIRSYTWEIVNGESLLSTMSPMDEEQTHAATERVKEGLQEAIDEAKK